MKLRQYIEKLLLLRVHPEHAARPRSSGKSVTACHEGPNIHT